MNWNDIVRRNKVTTSTGRKQPRNNASDIKEIRHNAQSVIGKGCSADVPAMLSDGVVTKVQHRDVEAGVCGKTSHFRTRRHDSGILSWSCRPNPIPFPFTDYHVQETCCSHSHCSRANHLVLPFASPFCPRFLPQSWLTVRPREYWGA